MVQTAEEILSESNDELTREEQADLNLTKILRVK